MSNSFQSSFDLSSLVLSSYNEHDFVLLDEHQESHIVLEKFFNQNDYDSANLPSLILQGEKFSGKTHLLNIFAQKQNCKIYSCDEVRAQSPVSLFFPGQKFLIIDDVDLLNDDNLLFHIYNLALENKVFLLLSLADSSVFELKDLVSRLRNIVRTKIKDPDLDMMKILLSKGFSKRQLKIDRKIIDYLALNITRKYPQIEKTIQEVEKLCFENKKTLTLVDVRKSLPTVIASEC